MKPSLLHAGSRLAILALLASTVACTAPVPAATPTRPPQATPTSALAAAGAGTYATISRERLLATVGDLAAIEPYSGWRNSGTAGEAAALDYMAGKVSELAYLQSLGLEQERQSFHVAIATEQWETRVELTVSGKAIEVPAAGLRGDRDDVTQALRFDSDGAPNDSERNPVSAAGPVVVIRAAAELSALGQADAAGKIMFLDYAVIDRAILGLSGARGVAGQLLAKKPAGLVLVTHFSNQRGESHGSFVGDVSALNLQEGAPRLPILYVRLEDLASAGIDDWDRLARVEAASLTWDADVFVPGTSGNLVVRIPGADPSRAVILGAHIDSPNGPGAMDDGSGSAVLLEVACVLDATKLQPPVDLYLVWFGSEEIGLDGSHYFVATHQELLDRTLAMLQIDCLTRPVEGIHAQLTLEAWPYGRLGDSGLPLADYLVEAAGRQGVTLKPEAVYGISSDNAPFIGFDVPSANLIFMNQQEMDAVGGLHAAGHIHDPYDTIELAREMGDVLEAMARTALVVALEAGRDAPPLRVTREAEHRAVFVASHTEPPQMTPAAFTDLGMALAWEGYDVDLVPYGRRVTAADLEGAALVVVLPVVDYGVENVNRMPGDEVWSEAEVAALESYVAEGGLLVLANSTNRLNLWMRAVEMNEDWGRLNTLAERFGVRYEGGSQHGAQATAERDSPLFEGQRTLALNESNGFGFSISSGQVLARAGDEPAVALVEQGRGQVLVLADVGILAPGPAGAANLRFYQNLARYAASR